MQRVSYKIYQRERERRREHSNKKISLSIKNAIDGKMAKMFNINSIDSLDPYITLASKCFDYPSILGHIV